MTEPDKPETPLQTLTRLQAEGRRTLGWLEISWLAKHEVEHQKYLYALNMEAWNKSADDIINRMLAEHGINPPKKRRTR